MASLNLTDAMDLLASGEMESLGLLPWGSNYTYLVKLTDPRYRDEDGDLIELFGVYKPRLGESPLWDFPEGTLCLREYAAWVVSDTLGWTLVPPTVLRTGTQGFGSVQLYIDNDSDQHYLRFRDRPELADQLMRVAVFDLITNNADRKSGHCLLDRDERVWAIDHGICFNTDYKLRTVIWEFARQPIPEAILDDLQKLKSALIPAKPVGKALRQVLDRPEIDALERRIGGLLEIKAFPSPNRYERSVPWPPV
ncbi:MAG: SCO1664 family protein [Thermoflexales bacterium]